MNDIKFAFRQLLKSPGFTVVAVLTLALGVMAATTMYSVIYAVVLDPFPYRQVDRLMSVKVFDPRQRGYRTYYAKDQFLEIAERNSIFEGVIASTISDIFWDGGGEPQRLRGNYGTPNTFQVMGVPPLLGRGFSPTDGDTGAEPVVVLGYRFWQRQFAGDPTILGKQLRLNEKIRTVVGVMPKRFMWRGADVYLPIAFKRGVPSEDVGSVHLLGRLKPGVTIPQAEVDLHPIIEDLKKAHPTAFPENWRVTLLSFKDTFPSDIRESLWILFGAVGLLLLIACTNVSNLLLSKASSRQKEMAVRAALGASRGRLIRQLLTESLILSGVGGLLGAALAYISLHAILGMVPPGRIPDEAEITLNLPVLFFALGISGVCSVVFGLAPALYACSPDLANPLREAGRGIAGNSRQALMRKGLVAAEVALSLVLLVGAGLMIRSFLAMQDNDLGYQSGHLLSMRVPLWEKRYPDPARRNAFFRDALERIRSIPGVTAVGLNTSLHPFGNFSVAVPMAGKPQLDERPVVLHQVNSDYAKAWGISQVSGRFLNDDEVNGRRQMAVVNETFVRTRLEGLSPLGQIVHLTTLTNGNFGLSNDAFQIAGVVKDTLSQNLGAQIQPEVYVPYTLLGDADRLVTRTLGDPKSVTRAILDQIHQVDSVQPVSNINTIDAVVRDEIYSGPRFNLALFSAFGAAGLLLAVIGVYGMVSNTVAQQRQELGVRMALGASPQNITKMILRGGLKLVLVGIAIGLVASILAVRVLSSQIGNVSPFDPISFGAVSIVLLLAGLQACLWPAWRAAKTDPMEALRHD